MMCKTLVLFSLAVSSVLCQEDQPVPVVQMADQGFGEEQAVFQNFPEVVDDAIRNQNEFNNDQWNSEDNIQPQSFAAQDFSARRPDNGNIDIGNPAQTCGFSCSRRSAFNINIDGTFSSVTCSDRNADVRSRCDGCCISRGVTAGIPEEWSTGFISNNGECICCHRNNRCGGRPPTNPIPAAAAVPFGNK